MAGHSGRQLVDGQGYVSDMVINFVAIAAILFIVGSTLLAREMINIYLCIESRDTMDLRRTLTMMTCQETDSAICYSADNS